MKIWVDADNCSLPVRRIIMRAAMRIGVQAVFVANVPLELPCSSLLSSIQVEKGEDNADRYIMESAQNGDLAVTADIPLARFLVERGIIVINPRGDLYTQETMKERFSMRSFLGFLREQGIYPVSGTRSQKRTVKKFADLFDRELKKLGFG